MRLLPVVVLLFLFDPAAAARRAPGVDDAGAFGSGHWSAVLRPGVEFGTATPWGDLPVRTDWVEVVVGPPAFTFGVEAARTRAGSVGQESLRTRVQSGRDRWRVGVELERRGVEVEGFDAERTWAVATGLRVDTTVGAVSVRLDHDAHAVRAWSHALAVETRRGPWRLRLQQRSTPFADGSVWSGAGSLALAPAFAVGLALESDQTLWSIEAQRGRGAIRVGRVVEGPRAGATAVALEWRR